MADIADVKDAMQALAVSTAYPNGITTPSISGRPIDVGQGWPMADGVDKAMRAGRSLVSIYAVPSSTSKLPVPLQTSCDAVLSPPMHGMAAEATDTGFRLYGLPYAREYATAIVNGTTYSVAAATGGTAEVIAAVLAQAIPGATWRSLWDGAEVVIPALHTLVVRIGAPGTLGRVIDRQRQNIMLGVWSPTPSDRAVIGKALKVAVAQNLTVEMPDTSRSIWIAQGENEIDKYQNELAWRRDLTVQVQWDTVETYDAYEITSVNIRLPNADSAIKSY